MSMPQVGWTILKSVCWLKMILRKNNTSSINRLINQLI
jgi:hypothetical protein